MTITLDGTLGITSPNETVVGQFSSGSTFGFKNRIINGGMVIDQRNAGASVTPTDGQYLVDRWLAGVSVASKFTAQQTPSTTETGFATRIAAGFTNYLAATSSSAYSVGAGEGFTLIHKIEGLNVADLAWGTASAATVTLSFLVRSSLTGTFGGSLRNSATNRSYPFSYTISVANTWEQKTITIAGDQSGTWLTTNGIGISLCISLGSGSSVSSTAGAWGAGNFFSATGAVSVVGTSGATFYITGVQLEKGSVATSFDQRAYGTELAMCQRYYQVDILATVGGGASPTATNRSFYCNVNFPVPFRASPTMTTLSTIGSSNMNAGSWAQLDASRGYFVATNSVANDCALVVQCSGAAEL